MNVTSDSDDSAFLFKTNLCKRKALNNTSSIKKLRKNDDNIDFEDSEDLTGVGVKEKEEVTKGLIKQNISNGEKWHESDSKGVVCETDGLDHGCSTLRNVNNPKVENEGIQNSKLKDVLDYFSCPLCLKDVPSEIALISHMKQCGKRYNMTCKELLEALELHKNQLKKKTSVKLLLWTKKTKKVSVGDSDGSTSDLALGLALSKSLTGTNLNGKEGKSSTDDNNSAGNSKTTLERFGFTTTGAGKKKSKNWKNRRFILRERTRDEREKILTEKAAVVLLSQDHQLELSHRGKNSTFSDDSINRVSHLWTLAEEEDNADWYVRDLENFITNENQTEKNGREEKSFDKENENIDKEIGELNLPRASIFQQWKSLVNNKAMSDLAVRANSSNFYLHSTVLFVRFPKLLDMDLEKVFHEFNTRTIYSFLQYLYCGGLDGLPRSQVDNLLRLASSINYEELVEVLNVLKRNLISDEDVSDRGTDLGCLISEESVQSQNYENYVRPKTSDVDLTDDGADELSVSCPLEEKNEAYEGGEEILDESRHEDEVQVRREEEKEEEEEEPLCEIQIINESKSRSSRVEGDLEKDLFEDEENLNDICKNVEKSSGEAVEENERDCILISSGSSKPENERRNELEEVPVPDCDIPYFDPYEHFNSEIPMEDYPFSNEIEERLSGGQEVFQKDISPSPVIRDSPICFAETVEELGGNSPVGDLPEFCSTPVRKSFTQTSMPHDSDRNKSGKGRQRRTPCTRRRRSLANRNLAKSSIRKSRIRKENNPEEQESNNLGEPFSKSPLNDSKESVKFTSEEGRQVEVTPLGRQDYTDDVSPLPDYSIMNPSTTKKYLAKYGLKKSLSKNKAKKILRHIYEELHPMIDTRNGKVIKRARSEKKKPGKETGKAGKIRKGKKINSESSKKEKQCKSQNKNGNLCGNSGTPLKNVSLCDTSMDNSDREEDSNMEESDSFTEEPLTGNIWDFNRLSEVVYDFIRSNSEIHRKVLMYEPIWLESFRNQLFEKYNKKFKLADLMDCLDAECITFRSEKQRATNMKRNKKGKKLIQGK